MQSLKVVFCRKNHLEKSFFAEKTILESLFCYKCRLYQSRVRRVEVSYAAPRARQRRPAQIPIMQRSLCQGSDSLRKSRP